MSVQSTAGAAIGPSATSDPSRRSENVQRLELGSGREVGKLKRARLEVMAETRNYDDHCIFLVSNRLTALEDHRSAWDCHLLLYQTKEFL